MEDATLAGCIPVIVQDDVLVSWEGWLDVSQFSVRIAREDTPRIVDILREIPAERRAQLREGLARVGGWRACVVQSHSSNRTPPISLVHPRSSIASM